MLRPGQNNHNNNNNRNNRNRNRNNRNNRTGGGGGGGQQGGGNSSRVLDSNGPDVKLRGTPQTIAEKYMQLGRDAQLSGDRVMAESYFQHADHYYRLWLAVQPVGQPLQFSRRTDELDEDGNPIAHEGDDETVGSDAPTGEIADGGETQADANGDNQQQPQNDEQGQNRPYRQQRDNRDGQQRDGQQRDKFRPRWPRRNNENRDAPAPEQFSEQQDRPEQQERVERVERAEPVEQQEQTGDWEAPSFLKRPMPVPVERGDDVVADAPVERKPRGRRPKAVDDAAPVVEVNHSNDD